MLYHRFERQGTLVWHDISELDWIYPMGFLSLFLLSTSGRLDLLSKEILSADKTDDAG
jgi:hypothetical protein